MKNLYITSVLMLLPSFVMAKPATPTKESLKNLMIEIRDPYYSSAKKREYLQLAQNHMQSILRKELNTNNLSQSFIQNQALMTSKMWEDSWIELQTEFYASLHQQALRSRWDSRVKANKKIGDYGKGIAEAMIAHLGKYSGTKEGRLYNRWSSISVNVGGKSSEYRVPYFIFANSVDALVAVDPHVRYEEILPKPAQESPGHPSVQTLLKNTYLKDRDDVQELAEKTALNHKIYIRAVSNSAKTVASIHYLTGEFNLAQTESKVQSYLNEFCQGCSADEKKDYLVSAMAYVKKQKKEFLHEYTPKTIVKTFCTDLSANGYIFDEPKEEIDTKKPFDYTQRPYPAAVIDNTRVAKPNLRLQLASLKIASVSKTVYAHDLGVLFLTNALSSLNARREPVGTRLGCTTKSEAGDQFLVKMAIHEARQNVEAYTEVINGKIKTANYTIKNATDTLEYFTQTNVSATGEAVMTFPQGINYVLDSVYELDRDVRRRKRTDTIITWGGTIIGVGLALTGIGAPEGAAILIAVAGMTKGAVAGSYYLYRSQQEKSFYRELVSAKQGLGQNFYLDGNLSQHYEDYRSLRISAIAEFASSAIQFAKIHKLALTKSGGNVTKAHHGLKKVFTQAKETSKEVGENQLTEMIVGMVLN